MFKLSNESIAKVKKELERYEDRRSAIIPCLWIVQREHGWVSKESVTYLSQLMDMPEAHIEEPLSFYTMFNKKPVGRHHVQVCCNISCAMNGGRELLKELCEKHHAKLDEITTDGRFTFSAVECLGSCATAPMMQVNDDYHENLTPESAKKLLEGMK